MLTAAQLVNKWNTQMMVFWLITLCRIINEIMILAKPAV